jgi:hypothetical protein
MGTSAVFRANAACGTCKSFSFIAVASFGPLSFSLYILSLVDTTMREPVLRLVEYILGEAGALRQAERLRLAEWSRQAHGQVRCSVQKPKVQSERKIWSEASRRFLWCHNRVTGRPGF